MGKQETITGPEKLFDNYSNYLNKGGQSEQSKEMAPLEMHIFQEIRRRKDLSFPELPFPFTISIKD